LARLTTASAQRLRLSELFLLRDADMHSAYMLRRRGWLVGWVSVRHTQLFYQNGKTYLKTFSTIW